MTGWVRPDTMWLSGRWRRTSGPGNRGVRVVWVVLAGSPATVPKVSAVIDDGA